MLAPHAQGDPGRWANKHMKPKSQIFVSVAWMALCLLRLKGSWNETIWFLFSINNQDPRSLPDYESIEIWRASHGVWWFIGLIICIGFLVKSLIAIYQKKKNPNPSKDPASANAQSVVPKD